MKDWQEFKVPGGGMASIDLAEVTAIAPAEVGPKTAVYVAGGTVVVDAPI